MALPVRDAVCFLGQVVTRFRSTGALIPSSPRLARAMVGSIRDLAPGEVVVELGPGTGALTRELAQRFPRNPIVAIEFNTIFADRLRARLPEVHVVEGCASRLPDHLAALGITTDRVGAVVSGLPLLSLPREIIGDIFAAIAASLAPGRRYVQFTYSKRAWRRINPPGFRLDRTERVWLNLPPAQVLPFTRLAA